MEVERGRFERSNSSDVICGSCMPELLITSCRTWCEKLKLKSGS